MRSKIIVAMATGGLLAAGMGTAVGVERTDRAKTAYEIAIEAEPDEVTEVDPQAIPGLVALATGGARLWTAGRQPQQASQAMRMASLLPLGGPLNARALDDVSAEVIFD